MSDGIENLVHPYKSSIDAYCKFREEYRYLNTFFYLFLTGKTKLQEHLREQIEKHDEGKAENGQSLDYAMAVVTHVYSQSQFKGVQVARSDAVQMVSDFSGFLSVVSKHCVISAHRAVIDYAFDLLCELIRREYIELPDKVKEALLSRRMRTAKLSSLLEDCFLPISTESDILNQWLWLAELRNCIEHNGSLATKELVSLATESDLNVGDAIQVGPKEVGEALALVQEICSSMNQKAQKQYFSEVEKR